MRLPGPQFSDSKPVPRDDVAEAVEYLEEVRPGLLVAYSRGAAVAMLALRQSDSKPKVLWIAPAWQRGWASVSPPSVSGVILHGDADASVPLQHSCELSQATGSPLRVVPNRNHVTILKDKTNPAAGVPVPRAKVNECAQTLPDWGTSGKGSPAEIALQQAFTDSLVNKVASRWVRTAGKVYKILVSSHDAWGGWEWNTGEWNAFRKKPRAEQVAWAKEFVGSGIKKPVEVSLGSDGDFSFNNGHHRVMAAAITRTKLPVVLAQNHHLSKWDTDELDAYMALLEKGYTRRDVNPQGWKLTGSRVPPLEVVRKGPQASDEWIMSNWRTASKTAGLLQAPPKLVEKVTEWAQATFAGRSYELAEQQRKNILKHLAGLPRVADWIDYGSVLKGFQPEKRRPYLEQQLAITDLWLKTLKPWQRIPSGRTHGHVSTMFDFTDYLDGWRYKHLWDSLTSEEQRELRKGPLAPFKVTNAFDQEHGAALAGWMVNQRELRFWFTADVGGFNLSDAKMSIADITRKHHKGIPRAARHELQHVTQAAIGAMTGGGAGGLPKRKLRQDVSPEEQALRGRNNLPVYFKTDAEYQTSLTDAVDDWNTKGFPPIQRWLDATDLDDRTRREIARWAARRFIGERNPQFPTLPRYFRNPDWQPENPKVHRFFENIKDDKARWKAAVGTFYKEIARTTKLGSPK
jgi:hypothetical protein